MDSSPLIVTIMPSYLGEYPGCATDRENKFIRAVNSFLGNTYKDKYLIISSDGCDRTKKLWSKYFYDKEEVIFIYNKKSPLFSGKPRQDAINFVAGAMWNTLEDIIITYLDTDDMMAHDHLSKIISQFNGYDWVYYNDWIFPDNVMTEREVELKEGCVGTSDIAHKLDYRFNWEVKDGYGHDWEMIKNMAYSSLNFAKIGTCGYHVKHINKWFDN
jgi:hypothetical protein